MRSSNDHGGNDVFGKGGRQRPSAGFVRPRRNPDEKLFARKKDVGAILREGQREISENFGRNKPVSSDASPRTWSNGSTTRPYAIWLRRVVTRFVGSRLVITK